MRMPARDVQPMPPYSRPQEVFVRLAITGAYGSGKTTLARVAADKFHLRFDPPAEMRDPWSRPAPALGCSGAELIELTIRRLIDRSAAEHGDRIVSDGSLLHDWVFAKTLMLHGAAPEIADEPTTKCRAAAERLLEPTRRAILMRLATQYDFVVHLPIEFPLAQSHPPVSEGFRARSDSYLLAEFAAAGVKPCPVRGEPDVRLSRISALVGNPRSDASDTRPQFHSSPSPRRPTT
ncbi:hypothetical protein ACVLV4_002962 [Rathayibacter agropyri]